MSGEMEVLFSLTGRMHTLFRRGVNRIIDIEWMCADAAYAREIIKLAYATDNEELHKLAERVEQLHPLLVDEEMPIVNIPHGAPPKADSKYVATLR